MPKTSKSAQQVLNALAGSAGTTATIQKLANQSKGNGSGTTESLQSILNKALGNPPTLWSEQRCLYTILAPKLSISGGWTSYTEQELLNRAYDQGGITLAQVLGLAA